jgi:cation diffusion facilitator family transporter
LAIRDRIQSDSNLTAEEKARRKQQAALSSIGAGVLLTAAKLVVGLLSGSLALLSEALHSGLDLVGTALAYAAVRVSNLPPDRNHPYGHAKAENLAALFAVFLLATTSVGILFEAYHKAFGTPEVPTLSGWTFAVPALAIVVDWGRSRYLRRVAAATGSEALAADAANFASDLWSSAVVLASLIAIFVGEALGWPMVWLSRLDAAAGVIVAALIVHVAWGLAGRTVNALMDEVPLHLVPAVERAATDTPGVVVTESARLRYVGDQPYADVVVHVPRGLTIEQSETIAEAVTERVRGVVPRADVVVHTHPVPSASEQATDRARVIAARREVGVHHVRAFATANGLRLDMHMEVPARQTLAEAHATADAVEAALRAEMPGLGEVEIHIEPRHDETYQVEPLDDPVLEARVRAAAEQAAGGAFLSRINLGSSALGYILTVHCSLPGDLPITQAHARTADIERAIRAVLGHSYRVTVHPEPE